MDSLNSDKIKFGTFWNTFAIFSGTVIGVGIFGLPYIAMKAGFFVVFGYFVILAFFSIIFHRMLAEVALGTDDMKYVPGYIEEYLGVKFKKLSLIITVIGMYGASLAYLVVGGRFLESLLSPVFGGGNILYTLIFFSSGALLVYGGGKIISKVSLPMLFIFIIIAFVLFFKAMPLINFGNLQGFSLSYFMLPYGAVIFSLWGMNIVPELEVLSSGSRKTMMSVITWGIILAAILYLMFIVTILGTSGAQTTSESLIGFSGVVSGGIIKLGFFFGFLSTYSSFLCLGLGLKGILNVDAKISKKMSWLLTLIVPLVLYFLNVKDFIGIISFVGAFTLGIEGILVIFVYRKFMQLKMKKNPPAYTYLLLLAFIIGIIFQLIYMI